MYLGYATNELTPEITTPLLITIMNCTLWSRELNKADSTQDFSGNIYNMHAHTSLIVSVFYEQSFFCLVKKKKKGKNELFKKFPARKKTCKDFHFEFSLIIYFWKTSLLEWSPFERLFVIIEIFITQRYSFWESLPGDYICGRHRIPSKVPISNGLLRRDMPI